jgi:Pectate lyase superfamily protein
VIDMSMIGTAGSDTRPGYQMGNATTGAGISDLMTDHALAAAAIDSSVLGVANDNGGTLGPPLVAVDADGNVGIEGSLNIQSTATDPATVTAGDGDPSATPHFGSLYMRTDASGPGTARLYQYQYSTASGGAAWLVVPVGIKLYNVRDYGAIGDGMTNDHAPIQAAINDCATATPPGGCVFFPEGEYLISSALEFPSTNNMMIAGIGTRSQISSDSDDFDIFWIHADSGARDLIIRDIKLAFPGGDPGEGGYSQNGAAIRIDVSIEDTRFYNVVTQFVGYGLKLPGLGGGRNVAVACKFNANYVGALLGHGMDFVGCDINGGTYGVVMDNCNGGMKFTNCPLFGVLSLWVTQLHAGDDPQGNTIYLYDCETNFGPPPATGPGSESSATGSITLTGTPTTGEHYVVTIDGHAITVGETTGQTPTAAAAAGIAAINFDTAVNDKVTATAGTAGVIVLTASHDYANSYDGNRITISATSSAHLTAMASAATLMGGVSPGLWPGDPDDTLGYLNPEVGSGGFQFAACRAELHLVNTWCQDSTVIGGHVNADESVSGPQFCTITAGNFGASVKGKTQISTYTVDVLSAESLTISGSEIHQGSAVTGACIHLGDDALASVVTGCIVKPNDGNLALQVDDADNSFLVASNAIQSSVSGGPVSLPGGSLGSSVLRDNVGYNPTGSYVNLGSLLPAAPATVTFYDTYGVDGFFNVRGVSVTVKVLNTITGTFTSVGGVTAGGLFPVQAGGAIQIHYTTLPTAAEFFGE